MALPSGGHNRIIWNGTPIAGVFTDDGSGSTFVADDGRTLAFHSPGQLTLGATVNDGLAGRAAQAVGKHLGRQRNNRVLGKTGALMKTSGIGLIVCLVFGQSETRAERFVEEEAFSYHLEMSRDDAICHHMQKIYNEKFRQPWKTEPIDLEGKTYSAHSKYAFPKLPGVEHNNRFTFDMRYSKWPTSPEFEAIKWREGRYFIEEGSIVNRLYGNSRPMLVAEFDINNDGVKELILKTLFADDWHISTSQDHLSILNLYTVDFSKTVTQKMIHVPIHGIRKANVQGETLGVWRHIRPFILSGKTYLHLQHDVSHEVPNSVIIRERSYTLVSEYHHDRYIYGSDLDPIEDDWLGIQQICRFHMIPIE